MQVGVGILETNLENMVGTVIQTGPKKRDKKILSIRFICNFHSVVFVFHNRFSFYLWIFQGKHLVPMASLKGFSADENDCEDLAPLSTNDGSGSLNFNTFVISSMAGNGFDLLHMFCFFFLWLNDT